MRRRRRLPIVAVAAVLLAVGAPVPAESATLPARVVRIGGPRHRPAATTGRSLVRFTPGVDAVRTLRTAGATHVEAVGPGVAVGDLEGHRPRGAARIEPERRRRFEAAPNDPLAPLQWALPVQHADSAAARADGTGVTVAVLDSGVDGTHADLAGRVLQGADATAGVDPPPAIPAGTDSDVVGHGTAVAGVIAAIRGNGVGIAGLAPGARIIPVKVGDETGVTTSAFVRGMRFAIASGARVINLSFGGCGASAEEQAAVHDAAAAGIIVVAAGGNRQPGNGPDCVYPAAYDDVVAVGATTKTDAAAPYSIPGPFITLSAPGGLGDGTSDDDIVSTTKPFSGQGCSVNCYAVVAGTSFAAPYAVAVMALVWSASPSLSAAQVIDTVAATSIDLGAPGRDPVFGVGRVDAGGAVALALAARGTARVAGDDRYATAVAMSTGAFPGGAPVAYLARGDVFSPDALAAGPAAIVKSGPVLLSGQCTLPAQTAAEIERLKASSVVVLGGAEALCDAVLAQVESLATHPAVRRVAGPDRFATAAALAGDTFPSGAGTAYLARGEVFSPDALVGGPAAGLAGAPILLAHQCDLPVATTQALDALRATTVVVLGGPLAVCDAVLATLQAGGRTVSRLAGADRYATAVAIGKAAFPGTPGGVVVARGDAFSPDALSAAPFAARKGMPLLLGGQCYAPPPSAVFVDDLDTPQVLVAGGPGAVCDPVLLRYL